MKEKEFAEDQEDQELECREIKSPNELLAVFSVMNQLRPHLTEASFVELYEEAKLTSGYTLIGLFDGNACLGLMGYRVLTDFVHGRHLYIDDLVTTESQRSRGLGAQLLNQAKRIAQEKGCQRLRLCTGSDNERGKSFYERNGWSLRAVVYKTKIDLS